MWIYIIDSGLFQPVAPHHVSHDVALRPHLTLPIWVAHTFIHSPVSAVVNTIMIDLERNFTTRIVRVYRAQERRGRLEAIIPLTGWCHR
jgi:hypothetical protein